LAGSVRLFSPLVIVWESLIEIGAGAVGEKDGQVEGLGGLVQVKDKRRKATPV